MRGTKKEAPHALGGVVAGSPRFDLREERSLSLPLSTPITFGARTLSCFGETSNGLRLNSNAFICTGMGRKHYFSWENKGSHSITTVD